MSSSPMNDGAEFGFPRPICPNCFHDQQNQSEIYCRHSRTRAWFDKQAGTWKTEWPVEPVAA